MERGQSSLVVSSPEPGVDAGEALLGFKGGVASGSAERRRGGEGTLGVLGRSEVVARVETESSRLS